MRLEHWLFLAAGVLGAPLAGWLMTHATEWPGWSYLTGALTLVGSVAGALRASMASIRKRIESEQQAFENAIVARRAALAARSAVTLRTRLGAETKDLRWKLRADRAALDLRRSEARQRARRDHEQERARLAVELETKREEHDERRANLEEEVARHEQLAGIAIEGRPLREIVRDSLDSGEYEDHLGLVHRVREHLGQLSEALLPATGGFSRDLFPRGKPRILLVIDDLDRCPPDQVVKVLEATQLLVRTELFVVVIAMDVRYVTRALEKEYEGILIPDGTPSGLDYIEKIVQVPYRVPEIDPDALGTFLANQVEVIESEASPEESPRSDQDELDVVDLDEIDEAYGAEAPRVVFRSSRTGDEPEPVRVPRGEIPLARSELKILEACCRQSEIGPRSVKRLVNTLKLLKLIWHHRGGHREPGLAAKRAMLLLLAFAARRPTVMREVIRALDERLRRNADDPAKLPDAVRQKLSEIGAAGTDAFAKRLLEILDEDPDLQGLTLSEVGPHDMRLMRSFSFVGEPVEQG